ncbi:E3 CR1-alpha [Squirrel monkey adenovirus]|nr:E3 CR1-alpha [Squirrel monkey adenovirus]
MKISSSVSVLITTSILVLLCKVSSINGLNQTCSEQPVTRKDLFRTVNGTPVAFFQCPNHTSLGIPISWYFNTSSLVANFTPVANSSKQPPLVGSGAWNASVSGISDLIIIQEPPEGLYCCLSNRSLCHCWNLTDVNGTLAGFSTQQPTSTQQPASSPAFYPRVEEEVELFYSEREWDIQLNSKFFGGLGLGLVLLVCFILFAISESRKEYYPVREEQSV